MKAVLQFSVISFLISTLAFSQKKQSNNDLVVTIAPISLIDFFDGSSLRLGAEYIHDEKLMFTLETGTYLGNFGTFKQKPHGYLVKPGIHYLAIEDDRTKQYLGIEYQYKEQGYDFIDSIAFNGQRYEKRYAMNRKMNCISLKYTYQEELGDHFYFEYYFGLGIRCLISSSSLSQEEEDGILDGEENGATQGESLIRPTGKINTVNFLGGIKIGYILF